MWKETPEGILISIKVIPKANRSEIVGFEADTLKIRLAALPEKGQANTELIRFLAHFFHIAKSHVSILQGETSRRKKVMIKISKEKLQEKLNAP